MDVKYFWFCPGLDVRRLLDNRGHHLVVDSVFCSLLYWYLKKKLMIITKKQKADSLAANWELFSSQHLWLCAFCHPGHISDAFRILLPCQAYVRSGEFAADASATLVINVCRRARILAFNSLLGPLRTIVVGLFRDILEAPPTSALMIFLSSSFFFYKRKCVFFFSNLWK